MFSSLSSTVVEEVSEESPEIACGKPDGTVYDEVETVVAIVAVKASDASE